MEKHCGVFIIVQTILLNIRKSTIPPQFNSPEVLSSASDKVKLIAKNRVGTK